MHSSTTTTDLADLQQQAAAIPDAGAAIAAPAAADDPAAGAIDYAGEARDLVGMVQLVFPLYPSLEGVYTPEARERLAVALAPVLEKYGLNMGRLGPELVLAVTAISLAGPTYAAIKRDHAAARAAKAKGEQATPQPTGPAPEERGAQQPVIAVTDPSSLHTRV